MKKTLVLLIVLTMMTTMVFAAGTQETTKKTVINFPTAATTGAIYPLGSAIANLWNTKLPHVRASAQASAGGIANLNMVADGEAQMGVAVTSIMYESFNGIGSFEGRANPNLRVMVGLYPNPNQVVVAKNSGVNSIKDLVGKDSLPELLVQRQKLKPTSTLILPKLIILCFKSSVCRFY